MRILLVIEAGYEEDDHIGFDGSGTWFDDTGRALPFNADNENALEQALQLKEQVGNGSHLTVLCMGGNRAREAVRRCLSFGCDRGIQVVDHFARRRTTPQFANILARFCARTSFDVIVTGAGLGEAGAKVARSLGCRRALGVAGVRYDRAGAVLDCLLEGVSPPQQLELPALLSSTSAAISPRIPSLATQLKARNKQIVVRQVSEFLQRETGRDAGEGRLAPAYGV